MGRPSKQAASLEHNIIAAIGTGLPISAAAEMHGVPGDTFRLWMRKSPELSAAVKRAEAELQAMALKPIISAIKGGDIKAAMWFLEHRFGTEWAEVNRLGVYIELAQLAEQRDRLIAEGVPDIKPLHEWWLDLEEQRAQDRRRNTRTRLRSRSVHALPAASA